MSVPSASPPPSASVDAARAAIPTLVNRQSGSAGDVLAALADVPGLRVMALDPDALLEAVREAVLAGAPRIAISGGDGTLASAAALVAGTGTEMAIIPGGTLNHFARDLDIPGDPVEAARVALTGRAIPVDVGRVNGQLFLNTSSVGAYVTFVRTRERLERRFGYVISSILAGIRILAGLHGFRVVLEVEGRDLVYRTPLVFVGVGERELKMPRLGARAANGRRGLHVFVVRGRHRARLLAFALAVATRGARGTRRAERTPHLDDFLVDRFRIEMRRPRGNVAVDGEVRPMRAPLDFAVERDALRVVVSAEQARTVLASR